MRLQNQTASLHADFDYRVVLDDKVESCNYIERAKGCTYRRSISEHVCLKCLSVVNWIKWNAADTRATSTCSCGQKSSIEIISFNKVAE